jgi:hypothetical protein
MTKKIHNLLKITFFFSLTFFIFASIFPNHTKKVVTSDQAQEKISDLQKLLENFKQYKTTNKFHSGNLFQHSVWTASAVLNWFEQDDQWVKDIEKKDLKLAFVSALLHDVGKGGDLDFIFYTKPDHAQKGLEYCINQKEYLLSKSQKFDFQKMFESLSINAEDKKLICTLIGIHEIFGKEVLDKYQKNSSLIFENFLTTIESIAKKTDYNKGKIDLRLLRLALLISAADVKGAQKVTCSSTSLSKYLKDFGINLTTDFFEADHEKSGKSKNKYDKFDFEDKGKKIRSELVYYLIKRSNKETLKSCVDSIKGWITGTEAETNK